MEIVQKYRWSLLVVGLLGSALLVAALGSWHPAALAGKDDTEKPKSEPTPAEVAALAEGQSLFRGLCSGCHGGAGRGGKGPDLTRKKFSHGSTDADIINTIRNGVPKTTMKKLGDSLKDDQIAKLLLFIRSLQSAP